MCEAIAAMSGGRTTVPGLSPWYRGDGRPDTEEQVTQILGIKGSGDLLEGK